MKLSEASFSIAPTLETLDPWLREQEKAFPLRAHTQKKVVFHHENKGIQKTLWSVVYLHGFSASRTEADPLSLKLAQQLGANLFYTRFTGHGLGADELGQARYEDWILDTQEAFKIGELIGEKVLVLACSTGAALATRVAASRESASNYAFVFISPNFGLKNAVSGVLRFQIGRWLVQQIKGKNRQLVLGNELERICYTPSYPFSTIAQVLKTISCAARSVVQDIKSPLLIFYSSQDQTVNPKKTQVLFEKWGEAVRVGAFVKKRMEEVRDCTSPSHHVLCGDMASPTSTPWVFNQIVQALPWLCEGSDDAIGQ